MADKDLEELRKKKLEELQKKMKSREEGARREKEKKAKAMKKAMLRKHLTSEARQRLGRVRLAHPKLAEQAEMVVLRTMRMGRKEKINDKELKQILKRLS